LGALAAVIYSDAGSRDQLGYLPHPAEFLIGIVQLYSIDCPGNSLAVGTISGVQLLILYS
jgi:hypothetical protein